MYGFRCALCMISFNKVDEGKEGKGRSNPCRDNKKQENYRSRKVENEIANKLQCVDLTCLPCVTSPHLVLEDIYNQKVCCGRLQTCSVNNGLATPATPIIRVYVFFICCDLICRTAVQNRWISLLLLLLRQTYMQTSRQDVRGSVVPL